MEEIKSPVSKVPCGHFFHFDELLKYSEIEVAYSNFASAARGVDDEELKRIMESTCLLYTSPSPRDS